MSDEKLEQFINALTLAEEAFKTNNKDECRSFCNQALIIDPGSANAKALKGASVLISFTLAEAESAAVEALKIWNTITDLDAIGLFEAYKDIVIDTALEFRVRWYNAAKAHYDEFKSVGGAKSEWDHVKSCYEMFMNNVAAIPWVLNYPKFSRLTLELAQGGNLADISYAEALCRANIGKGGELGELARRIQEIYGQLKKKRLIKRCIIGGAIAIFIIIALCVNK